MRVRNSLGYADVPGNAPVREEGYGSPLPFPTVTPSVLPSLPNTTYAVADRWKLTPSPAVPEGTFSPSQEYSLGPRWRPTPQTLPRGGSPAPAPAPGVTRMWSVTPAIPEGYFRPTLPPGAGVPEVFTAPDGRRWFAPRPRMLPGELLWLRLLNALRGGAAPAPSTTPSTTTAPSSSVLLPAYDLFQPGIFGPGDATTEDPALSKVKADESRGFPFLPVLLLGGGAFLAYRVVRGKKGAQTVKAA